ncbi:MAG: hypothetical protein N2317_01865 [Syntrophales bacterium]|nr:hypothetical protein [Syntrophales bacterium]
MNANEARRLGLLLETMAKLEEAIAELYDECALKWSNEGMFWREMGEEERRHAKILRQLVEILRENPDQFEIGRLFNEVAINTVISGVRKHTESVRKGVYDFVKVLNIANDLESSLLEFRYTELFKTRNVGYQNLLNEIFQETVNHRNRLLRKIKESNV